jgi:hypothetical protein
MSCCSSLGEAAAAATETENMEEITVSAELEHAFGENHVASDGERYDASLNAEDDLDEGASDNVKLQTCYVGSLTVKSKRWKREVISRRARVVHLGLRPCWSPMVTKLSYTRASSHPAIVDILLHFPAQLYQLTPNVIAQLSNFF